MNRNYFNSFVLPLSDNLFHYAKGLLGDEQAALQVMRAAIFYWWEHRKKLKEETLKVVVLKTVRSLALQEMKGKKFMDRPFQNKEWEEGNWDSLQMPVSDDVGELLNYLPELHAEVICLRAAGRLSDDEICQITGLGFNNVHSILADARKSLRKGLGGSPATSLETSELLTKYYTGTTSLDEEEQLRRYFSKEENRESSPADFNLFNYFIGLSVAEMPVAEKEKLEEEIYTLQRDNWFRRLLQRYR